MIERRLYSIAFSLEWGRQMRVIVGPRQSGKTTLAKMKLKQERTEELYYLWDLRSVKQRYRENELFFTGDRPPSKKKLWVCFDEIHKVPKWKNILKGIFDETEEDYRFIITGSAKLDISRRAGDSLSGRYFTFHLFPLSLEEAAGRKRFDESVPEDARDFIIERLDTHRKGKEALSDLLEYSGFPEPFIRQSRRFRNKWSQDYLDRVITEDIGELTRIIDRDRLYDLYRLLPEMAGSPLSESSLASHIETSPATIKNYLKRLEDFYLTFRIFPYSNNIKRSLVRAAKCYLYDWTRIEDKAKRFENYIAVELQSKLSLWQDISGRKYSLFYLRNKEKQETDFLVLRDSLPYFMVESKYSDSSVEKHHYLTSEQLGFIPVLQICRQENVASQQKRNIFRISASRFFA